jgi:hypothetical protein
LALNSIAGAIWGDVYSADDPDYTSKLWKNAPVAAARRRYEESTEGMGLNAPPFIPPEPKIEQETFDYKPGVAQGEGGGGGQMFAAAEAHQSAATALSASAAALSKAAGAIASMTPPSSQVPQGQGPPLPKARG